MDAFDQAFAAAPGQPSLAAPRRRPSSVRSPSPTTPRSVQPQHTGASSYDVGLAAGFNINSLTPEEKTAYGHFFSVADSEGAGIVSGQQAVPFLSRAKLSQPVLGTIWSLADSDGQGYLTAHKFAVAMKLVAAAQQGKAPSLANLHVATPIPVFDGITVPGAPPVSKPDYSATTAPRLQPVSKPDYSAISALAAGENDFSITPAVRAKFEALFASSGGVEGYLDAEKAKMLFLRSRLPNESLATIWGLVNPSRPGYMDVKEFVIAMHFIQGLMNGTIRSLPTSLPSGLLFSSSSMATSPVSPNAALPAVDSTMSGPLPVSSAAAQLPRAPLGSLPSTTPQSILTPASRQMAGLSIGPVARHMTGGTLTTATSVGEFPVVSPVARHMTGAPKTSSYDISASISGQLQGSARRPSINKFSEAGTNDNSLWEITAEDKAKFDRFFDVIDQEKRGFITGDEAVRFFTNSKLPQPVLGQIWEMTDRDKSGRLYRAEFAVAMHLIQKAIVGIPVPGALPTALAEHMAKAEGQLSALAAAQHTIDKGSMNFSSVARPTIPAQSTPLASGSSLFESPSSEKTATPSVGGTEYSDLNRDMEGLRRDITSFTTRSSDLYAKRSGAEANLANLQAQKKDLENRLVQATALHDQEKRQLSETQAALQAQQAANAELLAEVDRAERRAAELRIESEGARDAAAAARSEAEQTRRKLAELEADSASLRAGIEQFRQQEQQARKAGPSPRAIAAAEKARDDLRGAFSSLSKQQQQQQQPPPLQSVTNMPQSSSVPTSANSAVSASVISSKSVAQVESSFGTRAAFLAFEDGAKEGSRADDWTTISHPQSPPGGSAAAGAADSSILESAFVVKPKVDTGVAAGAPVPRAQSSAPAQISLGDDDFFGSAFKQAQRPASSGAARPPSDANDSFGGFPDFSIDQPAKSTAQTIAHGGPSAIGQDFASSFGSSGAATPNPAESNGPFGLSAPGKFSSPFGSTFSDSFGGPPPTKSGASPVRAGSPLKVSVETGSQPAGPQSASSSQTPKASPTKSAKAADISFESRFPPIEKDAFGFDDQFGPFGNSKPEAAAEKAAAPQARRQPPSTESAGSPTKSGALSSSSSPKASYGKSQTVGSPSAAKQESGTGGNSLHRVVSHDEFEAAFSEMDLPGSPKKSSTPEPTSFADRSAPFASVTPDFRGKFDTVDFEFDPKFDAGMTFSSTANKAAPSASTTALPPSRSNFSFDDPFSSSRPPAPDGGMAATNFDDVFSAPASGGAPFAGAGGMDSPFAASDPFGFSGPDPFFPASLPAASGRGNGGFLATHAVPQREPSQPAEGTGGFSFDDAFGPAAPFPPADAAGSTLRGMPTKVTGGAVTTASSSSALDLAEDIESVKNLLNLGFPRHRVLEALEKFGYDEARATEYLLERQEPKGK